MRFDLIERQIRESRASQRRVPDQVNAVEDKRALCADPYVLVIFRHAPGVQRSRCWKPQVDAAVFHELFRIFRWPVRRKIFRRSDNRHRDIRADADRNHILLNTLSQADTRIKPFSYDIW